jgi:predicted permease
VVVELSLGVVILVGAMLMIQTFLILRPSAPGFDPANKLIALARLPPKISVEEKRQFVSEVSRQLLESPGLIAVAGTTYFPMNRSLAMLDVAIEGTRTGEVNTVTVSTNYLDVMGIPVTRGRAFAETDSSGAPPVALVNEAFVRRWLPGRNPLGVLVNVSGPVAPVERQIVGVVGDTRSWGSDTRSRPELFLPFGQEIEGSPFFVIAGSPSVLAAMPVTVRQVVSRVRPGQLVDRVDRLETLLAAEVAYQRLGAWLLGIFGGLAVLLAAVGLGSTLAWSVAERRREIGVRMALGAAPLAISRLIVRHTLLLTVVAVALGLTGAAFASRLIQSRLYGVAPTDVTTYVACGLAMIAVALVAACIPARRASRVDPLAALRAD